MKKLSFLIAALAVVSLSSCYVEERGGGRYHHPFWHHRDAVIIRGDNTIKNNQQVPIAAPVYIYAEKK